MIIASLVGRFAAEAWGLAGLIIVAIAGYIALETIA